MDSVLAQAVNGFLFNRAEQERTAKQRDTYKYVLREHLMTEGREDENGHRWLEFDNPLTIEGKTYHAICAQRRLSSEIDLDATETLVKQDQELYDLVFPEVTVRQFDEDALYAANQRGLITDAQLDDLITETETFAIVAVKS